MQIGNSYNQTFHRDLIKHEIIVKLKCGVIEPYYVTDIIFILNKTIQFFPC